MTTMHQAPHLIRRAVRLGHNLKLLSQPALGKTTVILKTANELLDENKIDTFVCRDGGTLAPTDTVMSMPDMQKMVIRQLRDAGLPNFYDKPDAKGILYIGEWPLMGLETSKGFQKLLNHEDVGEFRLPPGVVVLADGQRMQDRGVHQSTRAMESRFETHVIEYDTQYALDVALGHYHPKVSAFLERNPDCIDNYTGIFENAQRAENDLALQQGKMGAWANLRSWRRISEKYEDMDKTGEPIFPEEIIANVGSGVASTFATFQTMLDNLATMEDIIAHPDKAMVPDKMDGRWALSTMLALTVDKEKFKPVSIYMNRYPAELQTAFFKLMNDRVNRVKAHLLSIRDTQEYKKWITASHISKILLGASAA